MNIKKLASSTIVFLFSTIVILLLAECLLRIKNHSMQNYDIEMWRYALELKKLSKNTILGHEHLPSKRAIVQSVEIRTNEWGLRGNAISQIPSEKRRLLFL